MKRALLVIIFLLLTTSAAYSQEPTQPLQLTIKSNKQVYEVGEKINVTMTLTNRSSKAIVIAKDYSLIDPYFDVMGPDQKPIQYTCPLPTMLPPDKGRFITLQPKESYEVTRDITECWDMHNIGKYTIMLKEEFDNLYWENNKTKMTLETAWTGTLISNTITIEVVEKKNISKEEAIKLVQNYIRKQNIKVKDINTPSEVREYDDFWNISYAIEQEPVFLPPFRSFNVHKDTGETYENPRA